MDRFGQARRLADERGRVLCGNRGWRSRTRRQFRGRHDGSARGNNAPTLARQRREQLCDGDAEHARDREYVVSAPPTVADFGVAHVLPRPRQTGIGLKPSSQLHLRQTMFGTQMSNTRPDDLFNRRHAVISVPATAQ